jgi:hypothetical protein
VITIASSLTYRLALDYLDLVIGVVKPNLGRHFVGECIGYLVPFHTRPGALGYLD